VERKAFEEPSSLPRASACYLRSMAVPLDTSAAAAQLHVEAYRELGIAGRLRIALELSDLAHALAIAGIRRRHPECSDDDARRKLAELLYASEASVRQ
jgi:hypothetical protein